MIWLIPASAVLLLFVFVLGTRAALRRRAGRTGTARIDEAPQSRVRQFLHTGTHRMAQPRSTLTDLRVDTQAMLEEAEVASDLATLDAFLADVRDSVGGDEAVFWKWSEQRDSVTPAAWSTPGATLPKFFEMNAWGGFVKWAAEGRVMHFDADARVAVTRLAAAPVEHDGQLMGVLSVSRAEGLERGREHIKSWLPRHAMQVGRLVALFEIRRDYGKAMRQSQALLSAARRVQGHKSQETLVRAIAESALQISSATEAALIRWRNEVGKGWVQYATAGFKREAPFPLSADSLAARTCTEGTLLLIEDASTTGRNDIFADGDGGWPTGSVGIVPLKMDERVIGAIVIASPEPGALSREEGGNVTLRGAIAAASLEVVWEMEEVSRRARTDALTGLANRRAFDEQLERQLLHADRFGHSVSLILADVDHFKRVNDTWGHETGDVVLRSVAGTLNEGVRAVDVCARFGGEEIAILLPETALGGAVELADRLRRAVGAKPISSGAEQIEVTISCGVACYPDGVLTKEALFAAADRALYDAKNAGRNCVKSAVPKPTGVVR